jgi:ParB-like nuclease domain
MTVVLNKTAGIPPGQAELVPSYFATELIVTPDDNPPFDPDIVASLVASFREHGQLVPAWVCPSPDHLDSVRLCIEGNHRLEACRNLNLPLWAFDLGRPVPEEERIRLLFTHNHSRRVMSREETAQKAARYIELVGCTASDAARYLNISGATLSRAFGEKRIPLELRDRADLLGLSIRSLVAAAPPGSMRKVLEFALTPGADGKKPTRDQVSLFIRQLKQSGKLASQKARSIPLRIGGRTVTLTVGEKDSALTVAEDLKAIVAKLGKHADVPPDGWPFLFA